MHSDSNKSIVVAIWVRAFFLAWIVGMTLAICTLFLAAPGIRRLPVGETARISLGPLQLAAIHKQALHPGGYELQFSLQRGLPLLFAVCQMFVVPLAVVGTYRAIHHAPLAKRAETV